MTRAKWIALAEVRLSADQADFLKALLGASGATVERERQGLGDAPLRAVVEHEGRFAILSPCRHKVLRPLSKHPAPRLPCWECAEERAAAAKPREPKVRQAKPRPALASCSASPPLELLEAAHG